MSVDTNDARQWAQHELDSRMSSQLPPPTPLHAAAEAGAQTAMRKDWQAGLDMAVQLAVAGAQNRGLDARGQRRAATRMAASYVRKHPQP